MSNKESEDLEFIIAWEERFGTEGVSMSASDFMERTLEMEKFIKEWERDHNA